MSRKLVRFGEFVLDFGTYQLFSFGAPVRIEGRPLQFLMLLVEHAGELVTREEIAGCLWDKNVFVDIELGINTAARKMRAALGDNPDMPRYVRTVVGRGYQFIAQTIVECEKPANQRLFRAEEPGRTLMGAALSATPK